MGAPQYAAAPPPQYAGGMGAEAPVMCVSAEAVGGGMGMAAPMGMASMGAALPQAAPMAAAPMMMAAAPAQVEKLLVAQLPTQIKKDAAGKDFVEYAFQVQANGAPVGEVRGRFSVLCGCHESVSPPLTPLLP